MKGWKRTAVFSAMWGAAGVAFGQSNFLVGEWQGIVRSDDNVKMAFSVAYRPDGTYVQSLAVPPGRGGTGSGWVYSSGQYRMKGRDTVQFQATDARICDPAGSFCQPYPPGLGQSEFTFEITSPNQYRTSYGTANRVLR